MNKRAAIYARVSTDDQAETGYSLPSQVDACRVYTERLGYSVAAELYEDCSGAEPVSNRPQGKKLTEFIKRREVDAVIIHQVDRLSRDIVDLLTTVQSWLRAGVEIHAGDVGKIESELDIVLVIKGWQGSDERKKIRERSMRGKRAKAQAGRVVGHRPPYGYNHIRDDNGKVVNFEPDNDQAQIVRLIFQWYVYGDEEGNRLAANAIARRLSEMRIPTPGEQQKGYHRIRSSGMWQADKVIKILSHEVYAGVWYFGARIGRTHEKRPPEEWYAVDVPAIIDRDTWDAAQLQRKRNKQMAKRNSKHDYLLSGLIKCSCGYAVCGEYFSNHRYYSCSSKNNRYVELEGCDCRAHSVRADAIENDIWDSIVNLFNNIPRFEELLLIAQQEELNALDPKREELAAVESMILDTESEATEIGQALKRAAGIVGNMLKQDMETVNQRYDALCKRRDELLTDLETRRLTDNAIQEAIQFAEDVQAGINNADFMTKRRNLEMLKVQVLIDDGRFYVTSLAGNWDGDIRRLPINRGGNGSDEGIVNDLHL